MPRPFGLGDGELGGDVLIFLAIVGVLVALVVLGRIVGKRTPALGRMTLAERREAVGLDSDDRRNLGPKIADNVGLTIGFDYINAMGQPSQRAVQIDGIFGGSLDDPHFIHGLDARSGERRTFRVDRIQRLMREDGPIEKNIGWAIGAMVRDHGGLPHHLPPFDLETERVPVIFEPEPGKPYSGELRRVELAYENGRVRCMAYAFGAGRHGTKNILQVRSFDVAGFYQRPCVVFCGATGEAITEPIPWLVERCGGQQAVLKASGFAAH